jgi:K+-sensing histidine kinase KdpD
LYIREGLAVAHGTAKSPVANDELVEAIDDATDAMRRVETLVDELASIAQFDAGTLRLRKEPFDLSLVVRQCAKEAEREAGLRTVTMTVSASPSVLVNADRVVTRRSVVSLIWCAFRNLPSNGRLQVAARRESHDASASVVVSHTGAFDPSAVTELEREPGLYFASRMMAAHGGALRIETSNEWPTVITATWPPDFVGSSGV